MVSCISIRSIKGQFPMTYMSLVIWTLRIEMLSLVPSIRSYNAYINHFIWSWLFLQDLARYWSNLTHWVIFLHVILYQYDLIYIQCHWWLYWIIKVNPYPTTPISVHDIQFKLTQWWILQHSSSVTLTYFITVLHLIVPRTCVMKRHMFMSNVEGIIDQHILVVGKRHNWPNISVIEKGHNELKCSWKVSNWPICSCQRKRTQMTNMFLSKEKWPIDLYVHVKWIGPKWPTCSCHRTIVKLTYMFHNKVRLNIRKKHLIFAGHRSHCKHFFLFLSGYKNVFFFCGCTNLCSVWPTLLPNIKMVRSLNEVSPTDIRAESSHHYMCHGWMKPSLHVTWLDEVTTTYDMVGWSHNYMWYGWMKSPPYIWHGWWSHHNMWHDLMTLSLHVTWLDEVTTIHVAWLDRVTFTCGMVG